MQNKSFVFRFGDAEVREREFTLIKAGEVLPVQPKIFEVLLFLLHNPQRLIAKEELLNAVWGDTAVSESSLTRIIALLRRMLGDEIGEPRYIATVPKVGYRFVCPVEVSEDTAPAPAFTNGVNPETGSAKEPVPPKAQEQPIQNFRRRWLVYVAVLALGLIAIGWYLHRPLPPPHITAYTQLTHDGHEKWPVGSDGSRIYFTPMVQFELAQVSTLGGEIAGVSLAINNIHFVEDVSPDGSGLIVAMGEKGVVVDRPQWNVSVLGASLHRLPDGHSAVYSPDGRTVAYATEAGEIWLVHNDGSGARKLASARGGVNHVAWSPDGRAIRFSMDGLLWEISSNGSNLHQVLPSWHGPAWQCCGRWTSDGKFFIFLSPDAHSGQGRQIWAIDERHSLFRQPPPGPVQLTAGTTDWDWLVSSKDGKSIFAERILNRGELSHYDVKSKRFQPFLGGISAGCASFSRDGRFVAYVRYPEGTLWKADQDGSNPVQLTDPPDQVFCPRWSPDGKQILYSIGTDGESGRIYLIPSAGGSPRMLLSGSDAGESDASWSSDGQRIALAGSVEKGVHNHSEIRILDLATQKVEVLPGSDGFASPRWSPDGRFITGLSDANLTLKIYDMETKRWTVLLDKPHGGLISYPVWSKNSRSVYLTGWMQGYGVYRIPVTGGKAELVADLKDWPVTGWWNWMGLDPTDAPMMIHDIGSDDIYALTLEEK
jgi:DNA-binding winged helix-turn-helix (wHTH) protein/Tol biopolymer transport system component